MATIQDIFDWLNQGAQGDIPGTGGEQPNAPTASAQPTPAAAVPSQASPQDFTGGLEPGMLNQYNALVQAGVPPGLAHMILTSDQQQPGQHPQQGQKSQTGEQKKEGGLQGSPGYQAGHEAGMGLDQLFFGKPQQQQTQQSGQQGQQPGFFDMLSNWFNSPSQSDWSQ